EAVKKTIGIMLAAGVIALNYSSPLRLFRNVPGSLNLHRGQSISLPLGLPSGWLTVENEGDELIRFSQTATTGDAVFTADALEIYPEECGQTALSLTLFGIIPIKNVSVHVFPEMTLVPGGQPIGVSLYTEGILVVGISDLLSGDGTTRRPAQEAGLQPGDIILEAEGKPLTDAKSLSDIIQGCAGAPARLKVRRGDRTLNLSITAVRDGQDGIYRMGMWVRDSSAGVGTLTFYDAAYGTYGALGHAIKDMDTDTVLDVREGTIQYSNIIDIQQGERGTPGELRGIFFSGDVAIGNIRLNTPFGLFGDALEPITNPLYPDPIPVASHSEVHTGPATLLTTIDSEGIREYSCRIIRVFSQDRPAIKSMVIEIDDPELLAKTGGIVQGMSGSPIIQDGKLAGAITHVFINDPTKGHAVFVEWMLMQSIPDE
ncbi:MAG: SpoIVB peptidase, partial [Christensenellales bacterium]